MPTPQGLLKIAGIDAQKLLQGQLTCDITEITPTESRWGAHCNPQGRIISLFKIFRIDTDYYLQMPKSLLPIALKALQKYAVFYKTTLTDISDLHPELIKPTDPNIPAIYPETSEKFLPHELNLHLMDAISFDKGCYTGQEIIARMHYLGKLKTHLSQIKLQLKNPPERGTLLENYGQVVDYNQIDYNTYEIFTVTQAKK